MPHAIDQPFLDSVLNQCIYALGCGARMQIGGSALDAVRTVAKGPNINAAGFTRALFGDLPGGPAPGPAPQQRWAVSKWFITACCEEMGRRAAAKAQARGAVVIDATADLKPAYNEVRAGNSTGAPGDFCPIW